MRNIAIPILFLSMAYAFPAGAQNLGTERRIKSVTSYNLEKKMKELDHVTLYNNEGLKTEENEYFADGMVKTKTLYEYDNNKNCIKITRYNTKGKIEKITIIEYDASGNKIRESTLNTAKHLKTEKVFEYTFY